MFAVDDGIWSGNLNFADVLFLIAVILFVIYGVIAFAAGPHSPDRTGWVVDTRLHNVLLGFGLACVALAFMVL